MSQLIQGPKMEFVVGESKQVEFFVTRGLYDDTTGKITGYQRVSLSGWSFTLTVASARNAAQVLSLAGVIDTDQTGNRGRFSFTVSGSGLESEYRTFLYQIQMVDDAGNRSRTIWGFWDVVQSI